MAINENLLTELLREYDIPQNIIELVMPHIEILEFKKGDVLIKHGESSKFVGLLYKGVVRWYQEMPDEQDSVFFFRQEGEFIAASSSFFNDDPAHGSFQALEDGALFYIDQNLFHEVSRKDPNFMTICYRILSRIMMEALNERNHLLRLTATERYLFFLETYPSLVHRISLGNISAYLGMRQSSLSRVRREVAQNGL